MQRAQLLTDLGRWEAAADVLSSALAERPHDGQLLAQFAAAAYNCGDLDSAYAAAQSAMVHAPDTSALALGVLARVYLAADLTEAAVEFARRAMESSSTADADAHMLLATCQSYLPARREAAASVDRSLELESRDPDLFLAAALVSERIGDGRAAQFVTAGLELDPAHSDLQTMAAAAHSFTGTRAEKLAAVLAENPTHRRARHALAQTVWASIARLASGVWIYGLAVILCSMWMPPSVLRHVAPVLVAPLFVHWSRVFRQLRKRLPPGYLSRRLRRSPTALLGIGLAAFAAVIATMSPVLIVVGWSPAGVRLGYFALIVACLLAGLAHVLVTIGRVRGDADVELASHLRDQSGYWLVWLLGLGLPIGLCWACSRWAAQPGALWFGLMILPIVFGVRCAEYVVATAGRGLRWLGFAAAALFLIGCGF